MSNAQCPIVIAVQYRFSLLSEHFGIFFSLLKLASTYELKTFVPLKVCSSPEGILWVCTNSALEGDCQPCLRPETTRVLQYPQGILAGG